ncbi:rhodanese-like domain-containing protein [Palleronia rufa]|uniref:rhodanese-like domain-containing protein n=1 Tax=Palleronia rufa TaxID=1530186 RepID=UPI000562A297|nr:rhodanese-like domain-containing protein [Palleronia rufa]
MQQSLTDLVARAKREIIALSPENARPEVQATTAITVAIRKLQRQGRVPGAIPAPRGMLEFWVVPQSPGRQDTLATDKRLILFCATAKRSYFAATSLLDMGLMHMAEMDGGFAGWARREWPTARD